MKVSVQLISLIEQGGEMLDHILLWLERRQYRWHIVHIVLVSAILAMIDEPALMGFVGCLALAVLTLRAVVSIAAALRHIPRPFHPFDVLLVCLPVAFALALAAGGLWLAVQANMHLIGLPIFAAHAALLIRIAADNMDRLDASKSILKGA
jgi:hypothetical protein